MFETDEFRTQLQQTVSNEAARGGMERYETEIVDFLQRLASENESALMEQELRKSASERRSIPDALRSTVELTRTASEYAKSERRDTLQVSDMERAYQARFCQVWPFCRTYFAGR